MGERGSRHPPPWNPRESCGAPIAARRPDAPPREKKPDPDKIEGTPSILMIWEALAGEREKFLDPHTSRATKIGEAGRPVVLVNASFVATQENESEMRALKARGAVGKVPDRDMNAVLREIEQAGFFQYARPTAAVQPFFAGDRMRGRITIIRGTESLTLVSQYGLGLDPSTRAIPGIYAAVKNSILMLKNATPTVGVSGKVDRVDPERAKKGEPPADK
jgi:hypothetical protein